MSKGKKGSKPTPEAVSWDEGLLSATVQEDDWRPYLVFTCPNTLNDDPHIEALISAVSAGARRRFTVINKTTMLQSAAEDLKLAQAAGSSGGGGKKSKAAATPPVQKPMFVEVCEQVVEVMKSGNPLPPSLLAKMIKYKILRHKSDHQAAVAQKEAEEAAKKQAAEKGGDGKGGKGGKGGGRASKAGKKGKETPAMDAGLAIPLPEKPPTSMRKRGEEDLDSKYIDDEPVDGPTCYFIMTGFTSLDLLEQLAPVGLTAHVLMNVVGGSEPSNTLTNEEQVDDEKRREEEEEQCRKSNLAKFWRHLGQRVRATREGHMLRDMAQVELTLPQPLVPDGSEERELYGQAVFDAVSQSVYRILEQSTQYHHYISYLNLQQLSLPSVAVCEAKESSLDTATSTQSPLPNQSSVVVEAAISGQPPKVDLRLYTDLLSTVPQDAITIPLMLHCMEEQVCAALTAADVSSPPSQQPLHDDVLIQITNCITGLCIPTTAKRSLLPDQDVAGYTDISANEVTAAIDHWDQIKLSSHHLSDSRLLNIGSSQTDTNNRALLGAILNAPRVNTDDQNSHLAMLHAIQHFCVSADISAQLLNHALLVLSLERVHLPNASTFPELSSTPAHLQFDFPFDIAIKEKCAPDSASAALVPYTNGQVGSTSMASAGERRVQYELDLPASYSPLAEYTVCEPMSKSSLLQLLQSLQYTHPYLSVYSHKLSQSTLVVAHSGFDGRPLHSYTWQSLAHSRVGFNNYLQYIAKQFGEDIDRAVEEDEERRERFEEEQQRSMEERESIMAHQQQLEQLKEEEEEPKVSAKGGKKRVPSAKKTPSGKKSKLDTASTTPEPANDTATAIEANLPEFEERKLYVAYNVGDTVLLNEGNVSVQFLSDGSQIHTEKTERFESSTTVTVSVLGNGHKVSCSMITRELDAEDDSVETEMGHESKNDGSKEEKTTTEEDQPTTAPVASIPQPPPGVELASLTAEFRDSLHISVSHFGPQGNGKLPFEPQKPNILLETPDASADSRPQSRQTPQKMNKKQVEQQQQLLEQQRQLEEQKKKERVEAEEKYNAQYSALLRQNKYQQLFASTPYGLHVHCQVSVDLSADSTLTDGSDGSFIVKQNYPIQSRGTQQGEACLAMTAYNEDERYYLPDGSVICFMKDGSITVLCCDGHIYQTATESLNELYQQHLRDQGSNADAQEDVHASQRTTEPSMQPTFSDTKVTFADQLDKIPTEDSRVKNCSDAVWVVTSPTGQRYLWKRSVACETTNEAESGEVTGDAPEGSSNVPDDSERQDLTQVAIVPLPSAQVFATTDPVTKQVLINREDNVTMLKCPDGSFVAEYADGTRITTTVNPNDPSTPLEVMVECPGFARVTHTASRDCLIHFPDGSKVVGSTSGRYTVEKEDEYQLEVKPCGESRCLLQPTESTAYTFVMDHTGPKNLLTASGKITKVKYSVSQDGVPTVSHNDTIPPHPALSPRYFVVPSNGNPYQILSQTEMNSFLAAMECQPDTTIVKGEPVSGFEGTTVAVMKALRREIPAIIPYKNGSIAPKNLSLNPAQSSQNNQSKGKKRFGVGVGRALSIQENVSKEAVQKVEVPDALKCRQFVNLEQFNESSRKQICDGLANYIATRQQQQSTADDLLPVDPRDLSEREAARDLKAEWLTKVSGDILCLALQDVQQQNALNEEPDIPKSTRVMNGIHRDLEQAEHHRQALRNHTVPLYFDSNKGQEFLRSQSPDMNALALQLAQPKHHARAQQNGGSEASHSSTPSTLQSASIILQPVGTDSPDVGEVDTLSLSSVSKIRPAHPTPDHAQGLHTPTNTRPTNPTPFHANRAHSPAASIVSQPDKSRTQNSGTDTDTSALESDSTAERSVSFMLPPRRPSLVVGGSQPALPQENVTVSVQRKTQEEMVKSKPNTKFSEIEDAVRRKVHTSSTMTGGLVRGFEVQPQCLEFGVIKEGHTYAHNLTLKNVGIDSCRFRIKQPPPSTGIKVIYTPGPVAAGMSRQCEVEMFAIAVGVVGTSGTGYVTHDLEVISEANVLQIPVRATVLTSSEYTNQQQAHLEPPAVGVRHIDRPSSREDFTRPARVQE